MIDFLLEAPQTTLFLAQGHYIPGGYYVTSRPKPFQEFARQLKSLPGFHQNVNSLKDADLIDGLIQDHGLVVLQGDGVIRTAYSETNSIPLDKREAHIAFSIFRKPSGVINHGNSIKNPTEPMSAMDLFQTVNKSKRAGVDIISQAAEILTKIHLPNPELTIRNTLGNHTNWRYNSASELVLGTIKLNAANPAYQKGATTVASILRDNPNITPDEVVKTLLK